MDVEEKLVAIKKAAEEIRQINISRNSEKMEVYKCIEKELKLKAEELLIILGLESRKNHKPSEMSGGEQQRVAVARSLINNPDIVFADEPSGNLDSKNAEELHQLFFDLRDEIGQTFVIVTHNKELANMADRKLEIVDGLVNV